MKDNSISQPRIRIFRYLKNNFPPRHALYPHRPLFVRTIWEYIKLSRWFLFPLIMIRAIYFLTKKGFKCEQIEIDSTSAGRHNVLVINHNLWTELNIFNFARHRVEYLIYILKIIPAELEGMTLSIGPRSEGELLLLSMHGFNFDNTVGIDLFSYSPKILVMDMHNMSFENSSFDTIICGWVLTYCYDLEKAISEIIRVAKNGALVAIGFSIPPPIEKSDPINKVSRLRGGLKELLNLFGNAVDAVYWQREASERASIVFRIKK